MGERSQFTFYRSFYVAINKMKKSDVADLVLAVCAYALDGKEPKLPDNLSIVFELIRPTLDSSARKSKNGKKGGRPKTDEKQTESKPKANETKVKANESESESKKENENEVENEVEVEVEVEVEKELENECYLKTTTTTTTCANAGLAETIATYQDVYGSFLSATAMREIYDVWFPHFGKTLMLYAIDRSKDAGKLTWAYTRAILASWKQSGYTTVAEVQAADAERKRRKEANGNGDTGKPEKYAGRTFGETL